MALSFTFIFTFDCGPNVFRYIDSFPKTFSTIPKSVFHRTSCLHEEVNINQPRVVHSCVRENLYGMETMDTAAYLF